VFSRLRHQDQHQSPAEEDSMRHLPVRRLLILTVAAACIPTPAAAQADPLDRVRVLHVVDSIVGAEIAAGRVAGMSVAMVRGRDTLLLKGYGRANLELDVPTPAEAVYDIASQAKTFTAAAVMQLVEQGKLSLDECGGTGGRAAPA
jgi:D-alanyl-D-alanine carboxypeptidase